MKSPLLFVCLLLISTSSLSQTEIRGEKDFFITFGSTSGNDIVIKVVDNAKWLIPTAIVLYGKQKSITDGLRSCDSWTELENRTYIIDKTLNGGKEIQEAIDKILNSQKLVDSKLYLIQAKDEFEIIKTKHGNINGGIKIQLIKGDLCRTMKKITDDNN
jgi:hypothetical protein